MDEQEIHLRDYWRIVRKRIYIVSTFFLVTFTVALIGTLTAVPVYEASTQILVEKSEMSPLMGNMLYNPFDPEFYETQSQLIKSKNVAKRVVEILSLDTTYDTYFPNKDTGPSFVGNAIAGVKGFVNGLFQAEGSGAVNGLKGEKKSKADIISGIIQGGVIVTPVKESRLFNVSYQSENPEFAKMIANTIAMAYMDEIMAIKHNSTGYALKWMTQKAEEEKAKLTRSEQALQDFMKQQDIVTIEDRVTVVPQKLNDFGKRLSDAEAARKELEALYEKVKALKGNTQDLENLQVFTENKALASLRDQIIKSEQQVQDLSQKFGEKHPVMKKARADLEILEQKRKEEIANTIESIRNDYELARSNEDNIRNLLGSTKQEAMSLNEKFVQYGILKREVETNKALYDALSMKIKEQGVTEETQKLNVWITAEAETPEFPVKPKKLRNIMLGIILGLFGGIGTAFFVEYLDNTVKNPEEAEARLGISVLGVIELIKDKKGVDVSQASWQEPTSSFAESMKTLRTSILLSSADAPPKRLLITSMQPQEGKTTVSSNLALTIAQSEYKVLLIDADLRRPAIHKVFGIDNAKGLSSYLAGATDEGIIHFIPDKNLSIIPSGPVPPNPSELLGSNRLKQLIKKAGERFDFVLIDSAPSMSATDSLILSTVVDRTVIVSRAGATTYEVIAKGLKTFSELNANILGMIINAMDMKKTRYHYYYGYYNYYSDKKEGGERQAAA